MSCLNKRIQFMRPRKNGRLPSNYPTDGCGIPLRITRLFPMKLKDVTIESLDKQKKQSDVVCLTEMMSLFDCFEKNEFNRAHCENFVTNLENCYTSYQKSRDQMKAKSKIKK